MPNLRKHRSGWWWETKSPDYKESIMILEQKADQIQAALQAKIAPPTAVEAAPLTVIDPTIIIQIITAIIAMISNCKKPAPKAVEMAKNPGIFARFGVRRAVKKTLDDPQMFSVV